MKLLKNLTLLSILLTIMFAVSCTKKDEIAEDPEPKIKVEKSNIYGEWQLQNVKADGAVYPITPEERQNSYIEFTNSTSWSGGEHFYAQLIDYSTDGDWRLENNIIYLHSVIEAEVIKSTKDELVFDLYEPDHKKTFTYSFTKIK